MQLGHALSLLSLALIACAGAGPNVRQPVAAPSATAKTQSANHAASRLGPPSPRGFGLRRIDRPLRQAPLALY